MKKFLLILAVVAMLLPGCKKIEESIDALENRIDKLEQETIPTIDEQIAAINLSLDALEKADEELGKYIQDLEAVAADLQEQINDTNTKIDEVKAALQGEISAAKEELLAQLEETKVKLEAELATINSTIETLKAKDAELDKKIADLKSYVDTELGKTTDWVSATFATLEQFYALSDNVAALKTLVDANKAESAANLATAIANLETSLKAWVGEQLSNYYTIAEVDAKILALQSALAAGDSALREELDNLKSELEAAKAELTEAYKKAIEDAITTNNGVINAKITNEIAAVNSRIDSEVAEINAKIAAIEKRLSDVEGRVSTIEEQIKAINASIANLEKTDEELGKYIKDLEATADNLQKQIDATNTKIDEVKSALQGEISTAKADVLAQLDAVKAELEAELATINATIETLKVKDAELDKKIADLKSYVDTELGKTTDWVNATFATLTQYNALVNEVTAIKAQIEAINKSIADLETRLTTKINEDIATAVATLNTTIQQKVKEITDAYTAAIKAAKDEVTKAYTAAIATAISNLETSLKAWVGEQLSSYYTIAEIDAKIANLEKAIADGDAALQQQLNDLKTQLESVKKELTEAYKKAIEEAITTNNGVINAKIASEIAAVNKRIDEEVAAINAKIAAIESRLDNVEAQVKDLLARIQSVSYIPTYSDGKASVVFVGYDSQVTFDFEVSPKDAVVELAKVWGNALNVKAIYTETRAVSFTDMPIVNFSADAANGTISVTASANNLSTAFFTGAQEASARLAISDGNNSVTSDYIPMAVKAGTFGINSKETLIEFASRATMLHPLTRAEVVADIDMTGYDWIPIEGFGADYIFDGGNHEIKGLSAPLFGTTEATIKNVKLTGVNYEVKDLAHSGAIACKLVGGSLENCSVSGTININAAELVLTSPNKQYGDFCHGGLVGWASAATITNCTNNANITITSLVAATESVPSTVGGVLGSVANGCTLDQVTNNGDVTYAGTTQKGSLYISGVVGKNDGTDGEKDFAALNNCTNTGAISSAKGSVTAGYFLISGITGRLETTTHDIVCSNLTNTGALTHNGKCAGFYGAGIAAYNAAASFSNCKNTGAVTIATGADHSTAYISGMFSGQVTTKTIDGLTNEGAVTIQDPAAEDLTKTHGYIHVSGIAYYVTGGSSDSDIPTINNVTNKGALSVGRITNASTGSSGRLYMAGLFNNIYSGKYTNCVNEATGTITAKTGNWGAAYMIGGIVSYISYKTGISTIYLAYCENKAAILADPYINDSNKIYAAEVGGVCAEAYANQKTFSVEFLGVKNSGSVTVKGEYTTMGYPYVGGFMGSLNYDSVFFTNCENSGVVNFEATAQSPRVGGFLGYDTTNKELRIENCINSGNVNYNAIALAPASDASAVRCGGFIGYRGSVVTTLIKGCTNTGNITLKDGQTATASACLAYTLGGFIGQSAGKLLTLENCTNGVMGDATKGKVYVGTIAKAGIGMGGMVGLTTADVTLTGCKNYGTIEQIGGSGLNGSYRAHLAGILGCSLYGKATTVVITNCENYGAVTYGPTAQLGRVDMGGIMATLQYAATTTLTGCKNGGVISFLATGGGNEISVGGIIGSLHKGTLTDCINLASGHIVSKGNSSSNFDFGGITGTTAGGAANLYNCDNYGHVDQQVHSKGTTQIGGIVGYAYTFGTIDGCDNHGTVTYVGTASGKQSAVGGVIGYARFKSSNAAADGSAPAGTSTISNCANYADQDWTKAVGKSSFQGGVVGLLGYTNYKVESGEAVVSNNKNIANITFGGTFTTPFFGGLYGSMPYVSSLVIDGGVCYGNMKGIGLSGKMGFCAGVARTDTCYLKDVQVGGNIVFAQEEGTDDDGNPTVVETLTPLTAENLGEYIYKSAVDTSVVTADGCTFLSAKPE